MGGRRRGIARGPKLGRGLSAVKDEKKHLNKGEKRIGGMNKKHRDTRCR